MSQSDSVISTPEKLKRNFVPKSTNLDSWSDLEPLYLDLTGRELNSLENLHTWLADLSEIEAVISEHVGWLYIKMTCNTTDSKLSEAYNHFVENVNPHIEPFADKLNKKFYNCALVKTLPERYKLYLRQVENSIKIFREENIPIEAEMAVKQQKFGEVSGAMSVEVNGKTLTLQQAYNFLKDPDRKLREEVYSKMNSRRLQDRAVLDNLFNELISMRDKIAGNSGFDNYRDYVFTDLNRFDYTSEDCIRFHGSVQKCIVPVLDELMNERKKNLKVPELKPWDTEVDELGRADMKPFSDGKELMQKTIACFTEIHPYFGEVASTLQSMNFVDLDSRIGKAPGGYNYPLYETGVPFIFMNASGSLKDVVTMVHEGGHAIHSMLTRDLDFIGFKELPSEIAELASMSMELISMEHWSHYFSNPEELRRAKREQLEGVLETLPWIACIDAFQHWIYTHPTHSIQERTDAWVKIYSQFSSSVVDWSTNRNELEAMWQKQLHLFEVPFYYIEYGIAQLGAIAVWRNYKTDPQKAIQQYMDALSLGYSKPIPEIYKTAGIRFDFSENYIRELIDFTRAELRKV
ncbi:MAG: M3 family oligoendopeptidase [Bacteroidia bacterium]|nr:M3 family oligoendopeptidase [Bacteroidia bacterium]